MTHSLFVPADIRAPAFLYGTAWKEDATQSLAEAAIAQGFRGIDTANQRRHYYETAVGAAIAASIKRGLVSREDLFLQTKFTFQQGGQDHRLPYDPGAPIEQQVEQSFRSSLEHLGVEYIDSYLLHGPTSRAGLGAEDWSAWRSMENLHNGRQVRMLGISNVSLAQLKLLCQDACIAPRFVQNRCYATTGWDREVREFCRDNGIVYQGFSLLTANTAVLGQPEIATIAKRYARTIPQIVFRFAQQIGMLPLTGTTDKKHMRDDLDAANFQLAEEEVRSIECLAT